MFWFRLIQCILRSFTHDPQAPYATYWGFQHSWWLQWPEPRVTHTEAYRPQARESMSEVGLWEPQSTGSTTRTKGEVSTELPSRRPAGPMWLESFSPHKGSTKSRLFFRSRFVIFKYLLSLFKFLGKQKHSSRPGSGLWAAGLDFCPKRNTTGKSHPTIHFCTPWFTYPTF